MRYDHLIECKMRYFFTKNHTQNVVERLVELLKQIKPTFLKGESLTLKNL